MRRDPELRQATSPTFHAVRGDTVLITVAVDKPLLARSVAIQWHGNGEVSTQSQASAARALDVDFDRRSIDSFLWWWLTGLQTGTPAAADGIKGHTLTYNFVADRPGTFTFRARYGRNRAATFTDAQGREAWPSAAGDHAHTDRVRVPRSQEGPSACRRTRTPPRTAHQELVYVRGGRGHACVEAQLMAGNTTIYLNDEGPVEWLLRLSALGLTAAALWVCGVCGGRRAPVVRRRGDGPLDVRCL
ncbi:hypothetical protein TRIUR3_05838 [Triticum urartu]|uniref:Plastocyanin-like domain-containing protein n=1 Tax=Triticum urartu TaxID=4572 RepID=M7YSB7_TRIUA|nr:hypothetical protein TRIUR3_05838 [Triticum urartu]